MNRTLIVYKENLTEKYKYKKQNNWRLKFQNCFDIENKIFIIRNFNSRKSKARNYNHRT